MQLREDEIIIPFFSSFAFVKTLIGTKVNIFALQSKDMLTAFLLICRKNSELYSSFFCHKVAELCPPSVVPFLVTYIPAQLWNEWVQAAFCFVFTASVSTLLKQHTNWAAHWFMCIFFHWDSCRLNLNKAQVFSSFSWFYLASPWTFYFFFKNRDNMVDNSYLCHVPSQFTALAIIIVKDVTVNVLSNWNIVLTV